MTIPPTPEIPLPSPNPYRTPAPKEIDPMSDNEFTLRIVSRIVGGIIFIAVTIAGSCIGGNIHNDNLQRDVAGVRATEARALADKAMFEGCKK